MVVPNVSPNGSIAFACHYKESITAISPGSSAAQYVTLDNAFFFLFSLAILFFLIALQNIFTKEEFRYRMSLKFCCFRFLLGMWS